jgi:MFS family permease
MRLVISFAALLLSVALLQLSSGGVGPLDALSGLRLGFSSAEVGLLGSAHFLGFFFGCWWAPRVMGQVGHSRAFAAFTAIGAIGLIAHFMMINPLAWAVMRMATGFCVAGCYTVVEAWLHAKVTNETRGRALGVYRVVDLNAQLLAQLLIGVLEPAHYISYNVLAILCCASLIPLVLTRNIPPSMPAAPRLKPKWAFAISPLAVAGVIVSGLTGAGFRMVGPVYAERIHLTADLTGLFLAAYVAGGALSQYPVGWLADRYDRRWVLIWISVASTLGCGLVVAAAEFGHVALIAASTLFGMATYPVYSIASAHAHDFAGHDDRVELSAALMFFYAVGAIIGPLPAALMIDSIGPWSLFALIAVGHILLIAFGVSRSRARPTREPRTHYVYSPRTSFLIGRLLGRLRDRR